MVGKEIVIVGAGMGGLALALRLAHRGHRVTIYEKTDQIGGRNRKVALNDCEFDGGPTLLMMLEPFERLFKDAGERIEDHLRISKVNPSYRVFYRDGLRLKGLSDQVAMAEQIEAQFGKSEAEGFRRLMLDLKAMYDEAIPLFVRRNYDSPVDFGSAQGLSAVVRHGMLGNFAKRVALCPRSQAPDALQLPDDVFGALPVLCAMGLRDAHLHGVRRGDLVSGRRDR
jgi:phytoene dehydrogenase-like protein